MLNALRKVFARPDPGISIHVERSGPGWLSAALAGLHDLPTPPESTAIERRAWETEELGPQPLWSGYREIADYPTDAEGARSSREVRSDARMGRFYAWLAAQRYPEVIVEFGTAYGVSGMYWLAGLNAARGGTLLTFEPNATWAAIADRNLAAISDRYTLTVGTFEDNADPVLAGRIIDIAFVDAIHTGAFVRSQYAILRKHMQAGGLVLFDDVDFSDDMAACWSEIAVAPDVVASARIGKRLGIVELSG